MSWAVDQASLGTPVSEASYGDTAMNFVTNVDVAAGGWAFLLVRWFFTDTLNTPTDDGPGLTWDVVQTNPGGGDARLAIVRAYCPSGLASGTTISLAWSSGDVGNKVVHGLSFTGGDASSFDAALTANSGSSGAWSISYTTGTDGELVLAFAVAGSGASSTATSGTEVVDDQVLGSNDIGQYLEQATAGSGSVGGNLSFSDDWWAVGIKLLAAAGGELTLDLGKVDSAEVVQGIDLIASVLLELGAVPQPVPPGGEEYPGEYPPDFVYGVDLSLAGGLTLDLGDIPSTEVVNGVDLTAAGPDALLLGDVPSAEVVQGIDLTAAGPDSLLLGDIPSTEVVHGIDLSVPASIPLELGHIPPDTFPPVTQPAYKSLRVDAYLGSSAFTTQLDEAVTNGAEHVRFAALWDQVETSDGTFVWTKLDQAVNGCLSRGLKCTLHIIKTAGWVGTSGGWDPPIHDGTQINHWRDWVEALVTRYGTDIDIYEIWNEPNGSSFWDSPSAQSAWPAEYATLLRNAAEAMRAVDPDIKIGAMNTNRSLVSGYLEAVYDALEADVGVPTCQANGYYFDYLSLHPYCLTHDPDFASGGDDIADAWGGDIGRSFNDFTRSRDIVEAREGATKPIYFGEFGYNTDGSTNNGPVADATRATYLTHAYDICRADGGIYALTWYSWQDGPAAWDIDGGDTEDAFIAYSMSSPSGGGPVYGVELGLGSGQTLSLGGVPSGEAVQGVDLTQAGPDSLLLGRIPSGEDVSGITLSLGSSLSLLLGSVPSGVTVEGITLSQSGAVSLLLGNVDGSSSVHGLALALDSSEPTTFALVAEFESGPGRLEYEGGVLLSEYSDGVKVVEF